MAVSVGRLEVVTSDHVVLRYDLAGAGNRGFAALLDFVIATVLTTGWITAWSVVVEATGGVVLGIVLFTAVLFGWAYFILLEWLWNGQTVGKRVFGLRVIDEGGSPARFFAVFVRNLIRVVDFLPGLYGVGLVSIVLSSRSQRLGDLAAGTFVVRARRPRVDWLALRTFEAGTDRVGNTHPIRTEGPGGTDLHVGSLSGEAQRLVREFVLREGKLPRAERDRLAAQIAAHLRDRLPESRESDDLELIRAVARSLRASGERR
ncbi:MAG TPA: RDD family protein [Candidatus Limnocylindria bacterium]|nr:RDD family protein [Candidatus Limnocylindria bacterium]